MKQLYWLGLELRLNTKTGCQNESKWLNWYFHFSTLGSPDVGQHYNMVLFGPSSFFGSSVGPCEWQQLESGRINSVFNVSSLHAKQWRLSFKISTKCYKGGHERQIVGFGAQRESVWSFLTCIVMFTEYDWGSTPKMCQQNKMIPRF